MELNRVLLEFRGQVAVVSLNHPETLNAMGSDMVDGLGAALAELQRPEREVRCVVLTGVGRGFCSGANLAGTGGRAFDSIEQALRTGYHPILLALRNLSIPLVTAVNGVAAGVGMGFAIAADLVFASKSATFVQAFARIGLVPDGGTTFVLPRRIGWARAMEMSMLAEPLPAEKALEWGLVNRVFEDGDELMKGAMQTASKLARGPKSLGMMRRLFWSTWHNAYDQQLELEAKVQVQAGQTFDFGEGSDAFRNKRPPELKGR